MSFCPDYPLRDLQHDMNHSNPSVLVAALVLRPAVSLPSAPDLVDESAKRQMMGSKAGRARQTKD